MRLFELDGPDPLAVKLVTVMSQLKAGIDDGYEKSNWTVDELLSYLKDNEIILDKSDLYDMIKNPPLNKTIENIQGDKVIFKGQSSMDGPTDPNKNKEVVKQMAQNAMPA